MTRRCWLSALALLLPSNTLANANKADVWVDVTVVTEDTQVVVFDMVLIGTVTKNRRYQGRLYKSKDYVKFKITCLDDARSSIPFFISAAMDAYVNPASKHYALRKYKYLLTNTKQN